MFCIVGAGLAGDVAAATLRDERYPGRIVMIGDEAHPPYDRPPISKDALVAEAAEERLFLRPKAFYQENGIELKLGTAVTGLDRLARKVMLANGEELAYEKLLLTTGTRPRLLSGTEQLKVPHFYVRTLDDARHLRRVLQPGSRVAIVGAGVIGMEVAASAIELGCDVSVIDIASRVLSRVVPSNVSEFIAGAHRARGVKLFLSSGRCNLTPNGLSSEVHGDMVADVLVIGVGVVPNVELAQAAGLSCSNGIEVDEFARTTDADVFAAGDVARYPCYFSGENVRAENWKHAERHGKIAAQNMLGKRVPYRAVTSMWSDQYEIKLQTVGMLTGKGHVRGTFEAQKFLVIFCNDDGIVVGALGINSPKEFRFAEMLVEKRVRVEPSLLIDQKQDLRKLAA
ncbi:FAD-dependent oxidoreductase [Bradyrhizobium barranii subsp. apii]|uniref:NAD(P)/FAD-dependent oxidoreductase n=1 Tax=Bradyrhizobium barranii TaxID=2992140 RepID=UPI001AA18190|nr:FAD-dependent oxidoreductase [Bradyrhizobium barranii]UPT95043.1 FAD-dependent oxidoreductase [Bradyrhizobium barranii subsp. apii]